jgi:succinoglycan biosynthesis protein ExoA
MDDKSRSPIDVSVIVPVRDEAHSIREAAGTIQAQRFDGSIELLFVDGRSEDGTVALLRELGDADSRIRILDNPARITPAALNVGLREARGEFVARMDAHALYPPAYVASGVERLRRGDVEWVCGLALPIGDGRWSRAVSIALGSWLGAGGSRKWKGQEEVEMDTGVFAGVWRRSTLERHGGWDEGWPANQDSELAARVLAAGGRIVCLPKMAARYFPRDSLSGLARQYFRYGYYRARTARRHPNSMRRSHLLAPALALDAIVALTAPAPLRLMGRAGLAGYAAAVMGASAALARGHGAETVLALPAVFATMHIAWGLGFLCGAARFGPPVGALLHLTSNRR